MTRGQPLTGIEAALGASLNERVLVLNRGYAAIRIISVREAFVLLFRRVAEVISAVDGRYETFDIGSWLEVAELQRIYESQEHDWVRCPGGSIAAPRIIRVHSSNRQPDHHVRLNRRNLFARDGNRCQYCGVRFPIGDLSIDHVLPQSRGGDHSWENLVCACIACNSRKGNRLPREAGMKLIRQPVRPRTSPDRAIRVRRRQYEEWKVFLNEAYWTVELRD
ncbi:MAG: HNH endonuclease [Planctomycetota bacterium]|nr:HNH endonuclease [Planctomycetota bacterium]